MLKKIGVTSDGRAVVSGVFCFYETHGLPLDIIFESLREKNAIPCWLSFYLEATRAGMKHKKIISMLNEAITDVYDHNFATLVCDTLSAKINDNV